MQKAESRHRLILFYLISMLVALLIVSPDLYFMLKEAAFLQAATSVLLVLSFLLLPVVFFCRKLRVYYFLVSLYGSLLPALFLPLLVSSAPLTPELLISTLSTSIREVYELLGIKIFLLLLLAVLSFYAVWKLYARLPAVLPFKKACTLSASGLLLFVWLLFTHTQKLTFSLDPIKQTLPNYYPFNVATGIHTYLKYTSLEENYAANTRGYTFGAYAATPPAGRRIIQILAIGESSRYSNWQVNGYNRSTSPYLFADSEWISFQNVAAGATLTFKAVPLLLTRVGVEHYPDHLLEKSVMGAYREAGFYTCWLSNHNGAAENNASELHTADADTVIYTNNNVTGENKFLTKGLYDEALLPHLQALINRGTNNLFVVVHLMGNHWNYQYRYPSSFQKFGRRTEPLSLGDASTEAALIDAYDNSILYADYMLHRITAMLASQDAITSLLFVSDHGENLNDHQNHMYLHDAVPTYYTSHIPLFIWTSPQFDQWQPESRNIIWQNSKKPVSAAESVFYSTLQMGGLALKSDTSMNEKSLLSPRFSGSKQLISGDANVLYRFAELEK